jgi:DNA-binding transcriptional ArsR family regulator
VGDWRAFTGVDTLVHQPARLMILTLLSSVRSADFLFLLGETGLSKGNLSSHLSKLEAAGLVSIEKTYRGKVPLTLCRLTSRGRRALSDHREQLEAMADHIRRVTPAKSRAV